MPFVSTPVAIEALRAKSVLVTQVTEFPRLASQTDSDRIFNYLVAAYPQYLSPSRGETGTALGYVYRYYAGSNAFIGTKEGKLYFLVPSIDNYINLLGDVADLLTQASAAGH